MEGHFRGKEINILELKKEAKAMNIARGRNAIGIEQILMVILLISIPIGITTGLYMQAVWHTNIKWFIPVEYIIMVLIQSIFVAAYYLNVINIVKEKKIELKFPLNRKVFIITFIIQLISNVISTMFTRHYGLLTDAIAVGIIILAVLIGGAIIYLIGGKDYGIINGIILGAGIVIKNLDEFIKLIISFIPIILLSIVTLGIVFVFEMTYIQTSIFLLVDKLIEE